MTCVNSVSYPSLCKCSHDMALAPSSHDWEVCRLLKVYLIGIIKPRPPLPCLWLEWSCLAVYTHSSSKGLDHPGWVPTLFFLRRSHYATLVSQTSYSTTLAQNLQLSSCLYLPSATTLGPFPSINSLPPQVICYKDRKLAPHPLISPINLHQWPYDESAQKTERHCLSLSSLASRLHLLLKNPQTATWKLLIGEEGEDQFSEMTQNLNKISNV